MRLDIRDAKRGISRYEYELEKLEKELSVLEEKMTKNRLSLKICIAIIIRYIETLFVTLISSFLN